MLYSHNEEKMHINEEQTNIIYSVDFEQKEAFPAFVSTQTATPWGLQIVESPVYEGKKAARFELRDSDPENQNGTRAEISFPGFDNKANSERWYAFAIYFPRKDYDADNSDEVISQWHQGGKATPSLCIRTRNNKLRLRINTRPKGKEVIEMGAIEREKWQYYVIHVKHSATASGLVEIWRNGVLLVNHSGANMYDLSSGVFHTPKWKLGVYKSSWNGDAKTKAHKRVLYFDAISIGNEHASLAEMKR
ncbi:hypothetical protein A4R26_29350 [Niastella populi]|uniref:Polysaccharide lyase n=2 Tax=Niastella populi TaxID=550983 RepID=A0A1V9F091_9BACT|nr:hypothetical protein A4R26_29350 [Niastella populi]